MGKSAPKPQDPVKTAEGQTSTNIGTAIAQQQMNNVNQVTNDGTLTYTQNGTYKYTDPLTNRQYDIPTYTATQSLSKDNQAIDEANKRAQLNMANLAGNQSAKIDGLLSNPFSISSIQKGGDPSKIRDLGDLEMVGNAPKMQTTLGDSGPIQNTIKNAGDITKTYGDDGSYANQRDRVEKALMDRMRPTLSQGRNAMESRLASQGIVMGSDAYKTSMDELGRKENDATLSTIINAGQEQNRLAELDRNKANFQNSAQQQQYSQNANDAVFGNSASQQKLNELLTRGNFNNSGQQANYDNNSNRIQTNNQTKVSQLNSDLARFSAENQARQQALSEAFAVRNQPINEISSLLSGTSINNPTWVNPQVAQIANTDYAGIRSAYDGTNTSRRSQDMQFYGDVIGGAMQAGSSIYAASDERLKEDIKKVGKTDSGLPIYTYRYKSGGPMQMGVMAQEAEKVFPKAVAKNSEGIRFVNYGEVM